MEEARFNLVDEPWLPVVDRHMHAGKVSLRKILTDSHEYLAIDGETPLQTVALLRLLIALVITILTRYDEDGAEDEPETPKEAKARWLSVYKSGKLPKAAVEAYFDRWYDRFYLFGGDRPFLQVRPSEYQLSPKKGAKPDGYVLKLRRAYDAPEDAEDYHDVFSCTWNTAAQLNGSILESDNKPSAVAERQGYLKYSLSYAEAAAWLVYAMAFSGCGSFGKRANGDTEIRTSCGESVRAGKQTAASEGCLLYAEGGSLFRTLMLNSPLSGTAPLREMYGSPCPSWEEDREHLMKDYRSVPDNLPAVLTQQSRRILLHISKERPEVVDGFYVGMGDYWIDYRMEPMFMWEPKIDKASRNAVLSPVHYSADTLEWQNYKYLFGGGDTRPTVAKWAYERMTDLGVEAPLLFHMTDIKYDSHNSVVEKMISGFISVAPEFFYADGILAEQAVAELKNIDQYAKHMYTLGKDLGLAEGMDEKNCCAANGIRVKSLYYDRIGTWFMRFLAQDKLSVEELEEQEYSIAAAICEEETAKAPPQALLGHGGNKPMNLGKAYDKCRKELVKQRNKLKGD